MKSIAIVFAVVVSLVAGAATHHQVAARSGAAVLAYGADTVCKLGCWG